MPCYHCAGCWWCCNDVGDVFLAHFSSKFTFIHLADAFILQSDLKLYVRVRTPLEQYGLIVLLRDTLSRSRLWVSHTKGMRLIHCTITTP